MFLCFAAQLIFADRMHFEILYDDDCVLVVNKPPGISTIPERDNTAPSLVKELEKIAGKLFVVHRIDKETSGIVCFAKTAAAHKILNKQFEEHTIRKYYYAIVHGRPVSSAGQLSFPIAPNPAKTNRMMIHPKGKKSLSLYQVEETFRHASLLRVEIKTGRTHQVRVHLAALGNPLLVDAIYGHNEAFYLSSVKKNYKTTGAEKALINRLTLHAAELHFYHPETNAVIACTCNLPADMQIVLKTLRKYDTLTS